MVYSRYVFKTLTYLIITLWFGLVEEAPALAEDWSSDLLVDFSQEILFYKQVLGQLSLEIATHKQWAESYQSKLLSEENEKSENVLNRQLNEIHLEIERLEPLTNTGWLDALSSQLDSNTFRNAPPSEIESWIDSQNQYISRIVEDVITLRNNVEQIQQTYILIEKPVQSSEVSKPLEISHYPTEKDDVLETTLLYLLAGLETWGSWLEPTNEVGLLPEAEGRFMVSSTPILQTGVSPGGIGVVGFAQPITISRNGAPEGFGEDQHLYETALANYDDHIEDVLEQVSYLDRLNYQFGIEVDGRTAQVYRKPIEIDLSLNTMLQKLGAPPEVAEIWVAEYAEIAHSSQTIQLSWLIAGNPLAQDYQSYVKDSLQTFDLNTLLAQGTSDGDFSPSQTPNTQWVNQDPFWEEVQKQPLLNVFITLLSDASEEIKRSFIVSLFFLESIPPTVGATSKTIGQVNNNENVTLRPKPFFWSDTNTNANNNPIAPTIDPAISPDQDLVAEAIKQKKNLIKYWIPGQGYQIIPWSERGLLNPNDQGTTYFVMAVTALNRFAPRKQPEHKSNYRTIVDDIIGNHLPKNQPVLQVFVGSELNDRRMVDNEGLSIYFGDKSFLWTAEQLNNDGLLQLAASYHKSMMSPYTVISIENGPYVAGPLYQIEEMFKNRQDFTIESVVIRAKGNTNYAKKIKSTASTQRAWIYDVDRLARDIFSWLPSKQDNLFIQSSHRSVVFEKSSSQPELRISSMVKWKDIPTNKELLEVRSEWNSDIFLLRARQGYLLIPVQELKYLQEHANETFQVHSLIMTKNTMPNIRTSIQRVLQSNNLNCESVRVISKSGVELAYSPQCSVVVTESGWELAQASEENLIAKAQESNHPIAIFHPEDKPASALHLNSLMDAEQSSLANLQVNTLVPVYNFEDLEAEEEESAIQTSIADAIGRTLQFFPKQKEFEVLMPEQESIVNQRVKYTSTAPKNFKVKYDYDKISVVVPTEEQPITFYSLKEGKASTLTEGAGGIELSKNDVITSSGKWNKDRIMELAQNFHKVSTSPYSIVQTNQGNFYGGSLNKIKSALLAGESPEKLVVMVTQLAGTDLWGSTYQGRENLGWLKTTSFKVLEHSKSLKVDPNSTVTVWSSAGKRKAVFTADGTLQAEQMIQWFTRPDNQTLKSLRGTWRGNMVLAHIPNQGYLLVQPNDMEFLMSSTKAQIDTLIMSFDMERQFSDIKDHAGVIIKNLPTQDSVRTIASVNPTYEEVSFYDGVDLAFYSDNQRGMEVDLQHTGLELAEQTPEQWLSYAEVKSTPLAVFQWPDGKKSIAWFKHVQEAKQNLEEIEPLFIVPAYSFEDLDESVSDQEEIEESIAITLQDTLQRALAFWPDQASFQIVMPHEKDPRHYSQDPPAKIGLGPLGMIELTRQSDNMKIKYYYRPSQNN